MRAEPIAPLQQDAEPPAAGDVSEAEYERRLAEIAVKRRRIGEQESELARARAALARFETLCQANVGDLLADLRHVAEAIARYRRQLDRLREEMAGAAAGRDEPLIADDDPLATPGDASPDDLGADDPAANVAAGERDELRRIYRELAKRCHPDLASDAADLARRQERMLQINEAFRQRDLDRLRMLRHEAEVDDPAFAGRPLVERIAWAAAELQRLDARLAALRTELLALRRSDLHKLWKRHEAGEAIFDDLRDDLETQLSTEADRLDAAIAAWRELSGKRAAAPVI